MGRFGKRAALGGEWFEVELVPELLELADEAFRPLFGGALVEVVGAEFVVGDVVVEDLVGGDEDRVPQRAGCFAGAASPAQPGVLGAEVAALGPRRGLGGFGQGCV